MIFALHVHTAFALARAHNVDWMWSPNVEWEAEPRLTAGWPGAEYVDAIGLDGHNIGTAEQGGSWQSPAEIIGASLGQLRSLTPTLRILITETDSSAVGGDKAAWITSLVAYVRGNPQLAGFLWSSTSGGLAAGTVADRHRRVARSVLGLARIFHGQDHLGRHRGSGSARA
jgi:hypothetical protein